MHKHILNKYKIKKTGVIHIGAHVAEEIQQYIDLELKNIIYIEANPKLIEPLKQKLSKYNHVKVYNKAISNTKRSKPLYLVANVMSSSLYQLNREDISAGISFHGIEYVDCDTLDNFILTNNINMIEYNLLVLDTQNSEYDILSKADETLKHIDYIQTEVFYKPYYQNGISFNKVNNLLISKGFKLVREDVSKDGAAGDCHYIRSEYDSK